MTTVIGRDFVSRATSNVVPVDLETGKDKVDKQAARISPHPTGTGAAREAT
jgi:hypothetical protein